MANLYRFCKLASSVNVYTFTTLQAVEPGLRFAKLLVGIIPSPLNFSKLHFEKATPPAKCPVEKV